MKTILITGGAGFIGSTLANKLSKKNKVTIIDDLSMGKIDNIQLHENITFIKGTVTDGHLMKTIFLETKFDYIFHLAAIASVADSVEHPIETHKVNFESVLQLLELIKNYQPDLKRLVFTSSAAVYGDEKSLPKREESVIRPLTPYAVDKFAAERYVLNYCNLYKIPTSAVRFFNVYGPNQNPNSPYSGVISIMMDCYKKILAGETVIFKMYGDGQQSRDFVFVDDVVQALDLVANATESLGEVYNVATGCKTSLLDLIAIFDNLLSVKLPIKFESSRIGDIKDSYADITKIKNLNYQPQFCLYEGIKKYVTYELQREE
ncbi:GDP-mannose 4,6-dehydratase [Melissococcus plutonius]|uniref:UDP-glucose 4-epimerase n=1 Tax=Melissococcus plutonius TaxID=33970 RepID=A0A2Z5Y3A5_9ENTE|nr:GDP-mannose 4,6-dehydratase [Melissococcus plutonius]BAL62334.1 UDP-glucose 4-epimerase [Melissococcus plutonius DAT561]MCV2498103.1 GDP-mannose 4,6-dehydratase [Melissococcus plutonius]MCV2500690.1 GDP-mannose 4,6-dehydratase [Melissococcus plutonius]MCV2504345.1 GDP-mannose 4,6-dehydratase [Melissococcus plutonius]MCV2506718.1 GDP-mannose 4,6-dehydratase [Melissococcus plutonius]